MYVFSLSIRYHEAEYQKAERKKKTLQLQSIVTQGRDFNFVTYIQGINYKNHVLKTTTTRPLHTAHM